MSYGFFLRLELPPDFADPRPGAKNHYNAVGPSGQSVDCGIAAACLVVLFVLCQGWIRESWDLNDLSRRNLRLFRGRKVGHARRSRSGGKRTDRCPENTLQECLVFPE